VLISRTFGQGFRHSRSALRELLPSRGGERREALLGGGEVGVNLKANYHSSAKAGHSKRGDR
jgi:hypothetical protein